MTPSSFDLQTNKQIELDQITILVSYIQVAFEKVYGADFDINEWDAVRIKHEFEELFSPDEFSRLIQTEFGKGILVGSWIQVYILGMGENDAAEEG